MLLHTEADHSPLAFASARRFFSAKYAAFLPSTLTLAFPLLALTVLPTAAPGPALALAPALVLKLAFAFALEVGSGLTGAGPFGPPLPPFCFAFALKASCRSACVSLGKSVVVPWSEFRVVSAGTMSLPVSTVVRLSPSSARTKQATKKPLD